MRRTSPATMPPRWHVFLADARQGKIAVPPTTFSTFGQALFRPDGRPTYARQTLTMQFQAPPQPGRYTFVMYLICDSYLGMDTRAEVTMLVDEMSKVEQLLPDEISEPDEGECAEMSEADLRDIPCHIRVMIHLVYSRIIADQVGSISLLFHCLTGPDTVYVLFVFCFHLVLILCSSCSDPVVILVSSCSYPFLILF